MASAGSKTSPPAYGPSWAPETPNRRLRRTPPPTVTKEVSRCAFYAFGALALLAASAIALTSYFGAQSNIFSAETSSLLVTSALAVAMIAGLVFMWRINNTDKVKHKIIKTIATLVIVGLGAFVFNLINSNSFTNGWLTDHMGKAFTQAHTWKEWALSSGVAASGLLMVGSIYAAIYQYRKNSEEQIKHNKKGS